MSEFKPKPYPLPQNHDELYASFAPKEVDPDSYEVVAGNGNKPLFDEVGKLLGKEVTYPTGAFANDEVKAKIGPNIRLRDVFVLASMYPNPNDRLMEVTLMGDTIHRADSIRARLLASKIAYDRQDRKPESRTPVSIAAVANQLGTTGHYRSLFTIDVHNEASLGTFDGPWDNANASKVLAHAIEDLAEKEGLEDLVVVAPDAGSGKRAERYAARLSGADMAMVFKQRKKGSDTKSTPLFLAGDVDGRPTVLVDDVGATGGSLVSAAQTLRDAGSVYRAAVLTHLENVPDDDGVTFLDRMNEPDCPIDKLLVTDTIFQADEVRDHPRIEVISVAPILAVAALCYLTGESMGKRLFEIEEQLKK